MKKIILGLAAGLFLSTSLAQASTLVFTYTHQPCESWRFDGTCAFKSFTKNVPDTRSLQGVINALDRRLKRLEQRVQFLDEENLELKQRLEAQ